MDAGLSDVVQKTIDEMLDGWKERRMKILSSIAVDFIEGSAAQAVIALNMLTIARDQYQSDKAQEHLLIHGDGSAPPLGVITAKKRKA